MNSNYISYILLFSICGQVVYCQDVYKAAIVDTNRKLNYNIEHYASLIREAASLKADILLLQTKDDECMSNGCVNYDEKLKTISNAAKEAGIYVAAHVFEKISCDKAEDVVRSNVIFNRKGDIIFVYRKPLAQANCNDTYSKPAPFSTDFGVTFGVLMEEDIILPNAKDTSSNNYLVLGPWPHKLEGLHALKFESSWSFITKSNVISANGIYGNTKATKTSGNVIMGEVNKNGNDNPNLLNSPSVFPENWSQYSIRPLDLKLAVEGLKEEICFGEFCCQFYIKTQGISDFPYSVVANTDALNIGNQILSTQSCALVSCAGSSKPCSSLSGTDVVFKRVSISGNFSVGATQFPILQTSSEKNIKFEQKSVFGNRQVNMEVNDSDLSNFGIFSIASNAPIHSNDNFVDSIVMNENVQEFFDYVWIRLRFVIFIVSIYILEMM